MAGHSCLDRRSFSFRAFAALLLVLSFGWGSGCGPKIKPYPVFPVSRNGATLYKTAQDLYWQSRARDDRGQALLDSMDAVAKDLRAAKTNDPNCPLMYSKLGEVYLECGQGDLAKNEFERSLDYCEDWVPGWIGLAQWAIQRIPLDPLKIDEATHYLIRADQAVANIQQRYNEIPEDQRKSWKGLGKLGLGEDVGAEGIPSDRMRVGLVFDFLAANEYPALQTGGTVLPRMRAKIWYQHALMAEARGEPAETVIQLCLKSHRFDPNYPPALILRSEQHVKLKQYFEAENILLPLMEAEPIYQNSAQIWYELAQIYSAWCVSQLAEEPCFEAEKAYVKLHDLNEQHVEGWIGRGRLNYIVGSKRGNLQVLQNAQVFANNALEFNPNDPEAGKLRELIDEAISELTTEEDQ
jgi:tetratricopeptide (TPR) repeat protein